MLGSILSPFQAFAYFLMRFVIGLTFAFHGVQKIFGVLSENEFDVGSQIWIGGLIELVCGFLIAIGLLTRISAFLASGTMAVAYTQFHWKPWDSGLFHENFFPPINNGESALLYCLIFFYIACAGAGRFSASASFKKKPTNKL